MTTHKRAAHRRVFAYGRSFRKSGWVCPVCSHNWGEFRDSCAECGFERDDVIADARPETMSKHDALRESDAIDWE